MSSRSRSSRSSALVEALERRQLLHAGGHFPVAINFQPASAQAPAGYFADSGAVFGDRGNGWAYGWDQDISVATRDRNANGDQRYDTLVHTQLYGTRSWEIGVPSGTYDVRLVVGDPSYFDSTYKFAVENVLATSGTPTSSSRFFDRTTRVSVSDGKLTVANASGSWN